MIVSTSSSVPEEDVETIMRQKESNAADNAVKLTVFQTDEAAAPAAPSSEVTEAEPKLRESTKKVDSGNGDVADVVKKWAKK